MGQTTTPALAEVEGLRVDPRVLRTRTAVLEAARAILVEEGWDGLTHLRVAERSGVTRATIYKHWPERSALFLEALVPERDALRVRITGDVRQDLIAGLKSLRAELATEQSGRRLLVTLLARAEWDPELRSIKSSVVHNGQTAVRGILEKAIALGDLHSDLNPDYGVTQLVAPVVYRSIVSEEEPTSDFITVTVDSFLRAYRP